MSSKTALWRTNRITVRCVGEFDSSPWKEEIERLWEAELHRRPSLFNGTMLNFLRHDAESQIQSYDNITVETYFMEYKVFIAKQCNPNLPFSVMPTGVSGMTICHEDGINYVVFAHRSKSVVQHPGALELVPSGNMSHPRSALVEANVPFHNYLREEYCEEFGLPESTILTMQDIAVVFDESVETYDMACVIHTSATCEEIRRGIERGDEYHSLAFVPVGEAKEFVEKNRQNIVPTSARLIYAYIAS